jgi:UDP-N-acetylmuramoylalanine--D-glutamate ligase
MTRLFFESCPAPIAGITGSSGKTTTTALVDAMLEASSVDHVVGGNIGVGLLGLLDRITPETRVVAELSHTQLQSLEVSPHWACLTNVTPNHLDQFTWDEYVELKRRIFAYQREDDVLVLNADDPVSRELASGARGVLRYTSMHGALPGDGVTLEGDAVVQIEGGRRTSLFSRADIQLRGAHNVANVLQATALASLLGASPEAIASAVRGFQGVPHRLEPVAELDGVTWVNDSIATTPERTVAGLRSYDVPIVLLLGGRDKRLPLDDLATEVRQRCRAVVTFGEASELFASALSDAGYADVHASADVEGAVEAARHLVRSGDVVLFSPAGTSFDAYPNFERRGEAFRDAVHARGASLPTSRDGGQA